MKPDEPRSCLCAATNFTASGGSHDPGCPLAAPVAGEPPRPKCGAQHIERYSDSRPTLHICELPEGHKTPHEDDDLMWKRGAEVKEPPKGHMSARREFIENYIERDNAAKGRPKGWRPYSWLSSGTISADEATIIAEAYAADVREQLRLAEAERDKLKAELAETQRQLLKADICPKCFGRFSGRHCYTVGATLPKETP